MRGVNLWIGIGTLGKDVDTRYLPSGDPVSSFSIAINKSYTNKQGEKIEATEWVSIVTFKKLAEIAGQYLRKGSKVYVEGSLKTQSWEKDGQKHYRTEIVARNLQMLDGKPQESGAQAYRAARNGAVPSYSDDDDDVVPF